MKINWKKLIIAVAIPLATGALSAWLAKNGMKNFAASVKQPPLSPPMWLFPIVWTILFLLMGIASYLVQKKSCGTKALSLYATQLVFNFWWSIWFFNLEWYLFAFVWLICLWVLILATTISFHKIDKTAGYLMIPYLLWVTFGGYLNLAVFICNLHS